MADTSLPDAPASLSLPERLKTVKIPHTKVVLSAVEDTLKDKKTDRTPTAYFAVILALLSQSISTTTGIVSKDLATSVVYLLDVVTPFTPPALLRSKFSQILTHLAPALVHPEADAPLLRPALGCLETLLLAQDTAAWALPAAQGPRTGLVAVLSLAVDHRPKVRKRALEALTQILTHPPPTPSLDHPAAEMCAETALRKLSELATPKNRKQRGKVQNQNHHEPALIHALQLIKTIAAASGGWPSRNIEPLCEVLLNISRSSHEYLTVAMFEVFEAIFGGMADEVFSAKLPRLMGVLADLKPSENDSHLLPPWIAVVSRGYDVSAQASPEVTFHKLPEVFQLFSSFLSSSSYNIRVSASEGLVSLLANCVPDLRENQAPEDQQTLEKLALAAFDLLTVKYQASWMEVFNVLGVIFEAFGPKSDPLLVDVVKTVGELRSAESFNGKKEADEVIGKAISAMGPEPVLQILPLNLIDPKPGQVGRAWMLPILRDHVSNARMGHFRSEFVPLSAAIFQKVIESGNAETMETKIFQTVVSQIWAILPGYCNLPVDLKEAFDQSFAEQLANILYKQAELRVDICKALQNLIGSNRSVLAQDSHDGGVTAEEAQKNLDHLAGFTGNLLAVLFNVYTETLPQYRGYILTCIDAFFSITPAQEMMTTLDKVVSLLNSSLAEPAKEKPRKQNDNQMPPMSHTFMTLIVAMAVWLPRESHSTPYQVASVFLPKGDDPQLQKKAYKLVSRMIESQTAVQERSQEVGELFLKNSEVSAPARRDRLQAIMQIVPFLPENDLHFIPAILSEVVISLKEVNEKARTAAFELLVIMGEKMQRGGTVVNSAVPGMPADAPNVSATLEEYMTMVSAGLAAPTPNMVSASITALTRLLYHFRESLPDALITELVSTLDDFLTSKNREIVRSVLGFVKVCVISLPVPLMEPRLETIVPHLMAWSHEHKARFRAKVKHILERMIRRFGVQTIEKWCPGEDRKLITNIRKTRERRKRKKDEGGEDDDDEDEDAEKNDGKGGRFESEFDQALYGSDDSEDSDDDEELLGRKPSKKKSSIKDGRTFIIEDEDDDPIDLLDPKSLSKISHTRPTQSRPVHRKMKAKTDADGKLILGRKGANNDEDDNDDEAMILDNGRRVTNETQISMQEGGGVNAYIEAIKSKDAVQRGQRGRLKFNSNQKKGIQEDYHEEGDQMDIDDPPTLGKSEAGSNGKNRGGFKGMPPKSGRGGIHKVKQQRRGLGAQMTGMKNRDDENGGGGGGGVMKGRVQKGGSTRGGGRGGRGQSGMKRGRG
ncbi:MAG: hypothetical protein M1823_003714 [Watsoniomyces obsoletus]|nr:MAG: hypothetical protein M1823_003714 [Watsoniomyces obsoletus]